MHIVLKEMALENFMMYAAKTFTFFDVTKIMAENGRGKSSIVNAYTWLMFNCDYELKDNPQIRRMVDGKTVDDTDVMVEAVFNINGKEVKAKKVQKRKYGKDGISYKDDNSYYINDVPKTMTAFNEYFDIDMSVLRICSNINAFISQKPAEMREFLFSMADDITDLSIAINSFELGELIPLLEKYSAEEIEAMNKATKAKIAKELPVLDGQILEKERDVQTKSAIDVSAMELLRNNLKEELKTNLEKQAENDTSGTYEKLADEIMKLKVVQQGLQRLAEDELNNKRKELSVKRNELSATFYEKSKKVNMLFLEVQNIEQYIDCKNEERKKQAELWKEASTRKFDETSLVCAYCGQTYPLEQQEAMKADFEKHKSEEIQAITAKGTALKAEIEEKTATLTKYRVEHEKANADLTAVKNEFEAIDAECKALPTRSDISDVAEYRKIEEDIKAKEILMQACTSNSGFKRQLKEEENELCQKLAECETEIAKSDTTADEERLEKLKDDNANLVQEHADAERILYLLGELSKVKNNALSDAINGKFTSVKWKLWELNKSGGYKNVCVPMYDGKSILDIASNKGNRILGKIDICNSIQKYKKINVPIFLDDVENLDSNNQQKIANMVDCQLIMLAVNDNKDLEVLEGVRRK